MASDLGIKLVFVDKNNKRRFKKSHFGESDIGSSEPLHELSPQESFKI